MADIKAGETQAYAELVRRVTPLLRQVARNRGVAAADLDDVVQDTLLALYCSRENYDPARPFLPWLIGITRHCAKDRWRRDMREDRRRLAWRTHSLAWQSAGADGGVTGGLLADSLGVFIALLPPAQRQVIELVAIGGMDLRAAAEATGRTVGAIKVNLHRAREALHQRLEACGDVTRPPRNRPASHLEAGE
ncbi:RNA polymerase sigma factor [Roseococcus sp. SDR]|uniref:RNA polymerase sigma factor n=1 Tax=Roseococcus sp. SDR TaxID=2835532 RepID=UPI001BCB7024|nr:RNA polymerase sigma factor [Roseococcus sp. SDR]MBS7791641.1 RNA polymerase sigma factor [Roseococcus sp. SDR]MBV1846955.1 RNA polymerase sigma factor [Roseococcus sp. SDR]